MAVETVKGKRRLGSEFWAIIGVGVLLAGLIGGMYGSLRNDIAVLRAEVRADVASVKAEVVSIKERLARIEGWIQGRFREGATGE
ncbi:MAG: hypothetical protein OXP66_04910 [Candidatus Tectomicrobia bacterium]|nr:hypothetical protein [Candidatus Tectomicrobia bacterium]